MGILQVDVLDMQRLHAFVARLEGEPDLAAELKGCPSPEAILALAERQGILFSWQALRVESGNLSAAYWPWAGKGDAWRRNFFSRPETPSTPAQGRARRSWQFWRRWQDPNRRP